MILEHPLSDEERSFLDRVTEFARSEIMPHADRWEAFRARSKPEFVSKCGDCLKEVEETA